MKKVFFFSFALITVLGFSFYFSSCSNAVASKIDVVNDIPPMDVHDAAWRKEFIAKLKPLSPEQRAKEIEQVAPRLNSQILAYLRIRGYKCDIEPITYVFGSGNADSVSSGNGTTNNSGIFTDQLYAVIKGGDCLKKDSLMMFVQCFNGVVSIVGDTYVVGSYNTAFSVEKGKGYNHYVDYQTSIFIAEQFNIPLYSGKERKVITPQRARELEDSLEFIQVTPRAEPGDRVDLGNMTYVHATH